MFHPSIPQATAARRAPSKRPVLVAAIVLGLVPPAAAQEQTVPDTTTGLTVDAALELALRHHPSIDAADARLRAAEATREQAGAWANPRLGLGGEGFGGDDGSGLEPNEFTASLGWPLNPLLTRGPRASVADARVALARAQRQRTRHDLAAATRLAYHRTLAADQRVGLAERRVDLTRRTVEALTTQVEVGEASPIQVLRAEVEHETARGELDTAQALQRVAHRELAALWSGAPPADTPLQLADSLRTAVAPVNPSDLENELLDTHPELLEARRAQEIQRRGEHLAARERWPELVPRAGLRWNPDDGDQDFVAGLAVELPLFDRRDARRRAAARRADAAGHDLEALRLELRTSLHTALEELHARSRTLRDYDERILPRAEEALARVRIGQEAGKFGALELLDAQRALVAAEEGHARAHATYDRVVVELESLLGRALDAASSDRANGNAKENRP